MYLSPHKLILRNQGRRRHIEAPLSLVTSRPLPGRPIMITGNRQQAMEGLWELYNIGNCHLRVFNDAGNSITILPGNTLPRFPANPSATKIEMEFIGVSDEVINAKKPVMLNASLWVTVKFAAILD